MMNIRVLVCVGLVTLLFTLYSCEENRFKVKIEEKEQQQLKLVIHRFDSAMYAVKYDRYKGGLAGVRADYGSFFDLYTARIVGAGSIEDAHFTERLQMFFDYPLFDSLHIEVRRLFPDAQLRVNLAEGFVHYHHYFPNAQIPVIYTFVGGVNQSIVIDDGMIGLGLDKYLGESCVLYDRLLGLDAYKRAKMYPAKLIPDVFYALGQDVFGYNFADDNLLGHIINEGRLFYFVHAMLPEVSEQDLFGFKEKQLLFCTENEERMWNYLIDKKLLFNTDYMNIKHFTDDGPFTSAFSKDSPARAASWIGYHIVCEYMNRHESVTLSQLMNEKDYQRILNKSKYKP